MKVQMQESVEAYPIDDVLDVLRTGRELTKLAKSLKNGVGLDDLGPAVGFIQTLPACVTDIKEVPLQLSDVSDIEWEQMEAEVAEFDLGDQETKRKAITHFIYAGLHIGQGVALLTVAE